MLFRRLCNRALIINFNNFKKEKFMLQSPLLVAAAQSPVKYLKNKKETIDIEATTNYFCVVLEEQFTGLS